MKSSDGMTIIDGHGAAPAVAAPSERSFGLVMAAVALIVALWPLTGDGGPRWWALLLAAILAVLSYAAPAVLRPANRLWFRFGLLLHRVVSPLMFGILYFLVLTPFALWVQRRGGAPLALRPDARATSYWTTRPPGDPAEGMTRQF